MSVASAQFQAAYNPTYAQDTLYSVQRDAIKNGICPLHLDEKIRNVNGALIYGKVNRKCPKCEILFNMNVEKNKIDNKMPDVVINKLAQVHLENDKEIVSSAYKDTENDFKMNEKALAKGYCYFHPHIKVKNINKSWGIMRSSINNPCIECLNVQRKVNEIQSNEQGKNNNQEQVVSVPIIEPNTPSHDSTPPQSPNPNIIPSVALAAAPAATPKDILHDESLNEKLLPIPSSEAQLPIASSLVDHMNRQSGPIVPDPSVSIPVAHSVALKQTRPIKSLSVEEVMLVFSNNEILRKYKYRIKRYSVNGEHIYYKTFSERDYIYYLRMTRQDAALFKRKSDTWIEEGVTEDELRVQIREPNCSCLYYRW